MFKSAIPILRYRDPAAAVTWLQEALGLERHFVAEQDGVVVHAQLKASGSLIFLGPDHADDKYGMHSPLALNGTNQSVYLVLEDAVDAHAHHARNAGAEIITLPYDTDYGGREYSCRDLEGHVWSIGSYRGEPIEEKQNKRTG